MYSTALSLEALADDYESGRLASQKVEDAILEAELVASGIPVDGAVDDCPWCDPSLTGPAIEALFTPTMKAIVLPGLRISRASDKGNNAGALWVTDGGPFGDNVFYGSIRGGEFRVKSALPAFERESLKRLAAFGAVELATVGKATGRCCYCSRFLEDPESVDRGYGPVCARHHGLPHGNRHGY